MNKLVIGVTAVLIVIFGSIYLTQRRESAPNVQESPKSSSAPPPASQSPTPAAPPASLSPTPITFAGTILAGKISPVIDFNQGDYDKAVTDKKLVVLYFYASWCPICREEIPKFYEAFEELNNPEVIAFRINYNDNETDDTEKNLAQEFGILYQHTKILVKNGEVVLRAPNSWDKEQYLGEIKKALQ